MIGFSCPSMPYLRRVYRLPAELEETLVADLWQSGTLGVFTESEPDGRLRLTAWFEPPAPAAAAPPDAAVEWLSEDELPDTDWMAEYRRQAVPFPLGRTLLIDPREPEDAAAAPALPGERRLVRLPARTAFGIGSHESTALALELLESSAVAGRSVLDVGTGTGILALAALAWGAARVVAFDADPVAAFQARANGQLNGLAPRLFAGRAAALGSRRAGGWAAAGFDLVVVNVVPEEIQPDLDDLLPLLAPGGVLILSGLLAERAAEVAARLAAHGLQPVGEGRRRGEWAALMLAWAPS
ncbi:MAG: 50S ribosomal protein L11 methyltransferase [Acidobacteria bacterium]|nr:50S ribosomal protein L11 methyltransferase [Acidobacteriota bacterium]